MPRFCLNLMMKDRLIEIIVAILVSVLVAAFYFYVMDRIFGDYFWIDFSKIPSWWTKEG